MTHEEPLGRLPGDIRIEGDRSTFYFPLASSILISILITNISLTVAVQIALGGIFNDTAVIIAICRDSASTKIVGGTAGAITVIQDPVIIVILIANIAFTVTIGVQMVRRTGDRICNRRIRVAINMYVRAEILHVRDPIAVSIKT